MDWNIAKSGHSCAACEKGLAEGEAYVSGLFEENDEFLRRDFCLACWGELTGREGMFSFWRTRVPEKDEKTRLFVDDSVIMAFFRRLASGDDAKRRNFRYILALMLMRKKRLKFIDARIDAGTEVLLLKAPREDDIHEVVNPKLTEEELIHVQEDLSQILETAV